MEEQSLHKQTVAWDMGGHAAEPIELKVSEKN
jgi:hypothetical protein